MTGGYITTDEQVFTEQEPPLGQGAEALLKTVPCLSTEELATDESLGCHADQAVVNFLVRGTMYGLPPTCDHAVATGFARVLHVARHFGLLNDHLREPVDLRFVSLGIDEPLALASLFYAYRKRKRFCFWKTEAPEIASSYIWDVMALAVMSVIDGTRSLQDISDIPSVRSRRAFFDQPLTLVRITGRNDDDSFITEDYNPNHAPVPTINFEAQKQDDIKRWCDGTSTIFLCPGDKMISDLVFFARAGQQSVWIFLQMEHSSACSETEAVSDVHATERLRSFADDMGAIVQASGKKNKAIPVVRLLVSRIGVLRAGGLEKNSRAHVTITANVFLTIFLIRGLSRSWTTSPIGWCDAIERCLLQGPFVENAIREMLKSMDSE